MALTTSSFQDSQPPNPRADADASRVYGAPGDLPDATRMHREAGISNVAAQHTTGSAGESAIADGSFTLGEAKTLGGVKNIGAPGSPGFPGLTGTSYPDGTPAA
jgi:hypothetical protein